jgi:hypothetical protein
MQVNGKWMLYPKFRWNDKRLFDGASYHVNCGPKFVKNEIEVNVLVPWLKLSIAVRE